jgi:hypothetical protein
MVARCQFRDDTAIIGVQRDLAVEPLRQYAGTWLEHGESGLVAGGLYAEDLHFTVNAGKVDG